MANCPNCGRSTVRTQDWACQWCGYPLVSGFFKKTEMTYQEAKAERLHSGIVIGTAVELESPVAEAEVAEEIEEGVEVVGEAETAEEEESGEAVAEAEVAEELEEVGEAVAEAEIAEEVEEGGEVVAEAEVAEEEEEVGAAVVEAVEEVVEPSEPEIVLITLEELNRICREDSEAAEARFADTILQVIGVVIRIPPMESTENPCIILTNSEKSVARNLLCVFDKQHEATINQLSVGQMVTVQGKYDGCVINILLNDCVLAN